MKELKAKILDYLALKVPDFKLETKGKVTFFPCPVCKKPTANLLPTEPIVFCHSCNGQIGDIYDVVSMVEADKVALTEEEISEYLGRLFNIPVITSSKIAEALDYYDKQVFDLVPIQRGGKAPFEKEWPTIEHKEMYEWETWIENNLNLGVKTGLVSKITVIDVDGAVIPAALKPFLDNYKGFLVKTTRGWHYYFKYEGDLPKRSFDLDGVHIDIENDGGQVILFPSEVEGRGREIICMEDIPQMTPEFKSFLVEKVGKSTVIEKTADVEALPEFDGEINFVNSGSRNNFLTHFGGILRKELNITNTQHVLEIINSKFVKPSLTKAELYTIVNSLDKYIKFDEKDLATKILNYLKVVGEADARDVKEVVGESKEKVDKTLAYLVKEGFVIKQRRSYHIIKKANWQEKLDLMMNRIKFKMPYFHDIAHINYGDMILLGSKSKWGKTTIAMNIVKDLVAQGIKPYYISLETGSRFTKTASDLGMKEGDFFWAFEADPTKIELENNSVTIIDWLLVEDKSQTDSIMKHFVEQLYKTNGVLIIFVQLKENGEYFAPNMIKQFPALGARYIYDNETDGSTGNWLVDIIREGKSKVKTSRIACKYDWETKKHQRVDEAPPTPGVI